MANRKGESSWADRSLEVREALTSRGYRTGRIVSTPEARFTVYVDGKHTLILAEQDGGWDLYKPLTESLEVRKVIAKIPTWQEDDSHRPSCAIRLKSSSECTCGKLDSLAAQQSAIMAKQ